MMNIDYVKLAEAISARDKAEKDKAEAAKSWREKLILNDKGNPTNCIDNYLVYLNESETYKNKLKYNEFLCRKEYNGEEFTDFILNNIYVNCELEIGISSRVKLDAAISNVFDKNRYNPVIDYINSLKWDGKERISSLFIDLLDVDNTELNRELTKKWFIAAVKRVYDPGCKFDNMIVLQGSQGIGKSSICELISKSFFNTISLGEIGNKDIVDKLNKTWVAIIDELDTFNKKEMSTIKTFLSQCTDNVRLAYARNSQTFKRHCIFIGSTNDDTFLRDSTSSVERRFWVLKCNKITMDGKIRETLTEEYVNQLWAEAKEYYFRDKNQYLDVDKDLFDAFAETQREFKTYTDDFVIDFIKEILNRKYHLQDTGTFKNLEDFKSQCCGDRNFEDNFMSQTIDKIPMSWLAHILKVKFNESRTGKYIALALSSEWEYKTIKYNGDHFKGLMKISTPKVDNNSLF